MEHNRWCSGKKKSACQYRRHRFDPWVGEIPWRREWQPTPACLPGKFHGQRNLAGCSPWGRRELDTTERLRTHAHTCWWWSHPCAAAASSEADLISEVLLWLSVGFLLAPGPGPGGFWGPNAETDRALAIRKLSLTWEARDR